MNTPFWESKSLHELSKDEWESLCDGCGLCCLHKLQNEEIENAPVHMTRVVCRCYDLKNGKCSSYANRFEVVEECTQLTIERAAQFDWLPESCAYRLRHHGKPLPHWHPLISCSTKTVLPHGIFQFDPVLETDDIDLEDYIIGECS